MCAYAVEHFGKHGFDRSILDVSLATGVSESKLVTMFGSVAGLRRACDEYVQQTVRAAKTEALTSPDPKEWLRQVASIETFAPTMEYQVQTLRTRDDAGRVLMQKMTDNVERYLDDAVRAGTVRPSRDPKVRARFLATCNGGGFLLYLNQHDDPSNMNSVLRDYARDMIAPALEVFTYGLLVDDSIYRGYAAGIEMA